MKKIITSILAASAVFGFVSCNKSSGKSSEVVVKLGVTGSVYEDLWEPAQKALKEQHANELKAKEEQVAFYRDFKARKSTKEIGESLEQYCYKLYSQSLRPVMPAAVFEKR